MSEQLSGPGQTGETQAAEDALSKAADSDSAVTLDERDAASADSEANQLGQPKQRRFGFLAGLTATLALVAGIAALGASALIWQQAQQQGNALAAINAALTGQVDMLESRLQGFDQDVDAVQSDFLATESLALELQDRLNILPARLAEFQRRLDAITGGTFDARGTWLRAEAEYYLVAANAELTLANNWESAIIALELADDRLRELGDPSVARVRDLIAGEISALRSVRLPDLEGMSFGLARLGDSVDQLPFPDGQPESFDAPVDDDDEPGWTRLWNRATDAFSSLIRIERRDAPVAAALSARERILIQRQLGVELQLARLALARSDQQNFDASLESIRRLLTRNFDTASAQVDGALVFLSELERISLLPPPPDISRSLSALRSLSAGAD